MYSHYVQIDLPPFLIKKTKYFFLSDVLDKPEKIYS